MMSALISWASALMLLMYPAIPGGIGPAGSAFVVESPVPDNNASRCHPLQFGIAGASTLWSNDEVDDFIGASGITPHYVHGFVNVGDDLPVAGIAATEARGHEVIITLEPWFLATASDHPLRRLAQGEFDDLIRSTANQFASFDSAPVVRFGHEMNGNWYPWGRGWAGNEPQDFVDAYRRTVAIFREQGVANVRWLWSPNTVVAADVALAEFYPGDDVVDLLGFDGYNGGSAVPRMGGWLSPTELLEPTLVELEALSGKPILLAETASARFGGDRTEWVVQLVETLRRHPQVVGFVWFEVAKETDWRLADDGPALGKLVPALRGC